MTETEPLPVPPRPSSSECAATTPDRHKTPRKVFRSMRMLSYVRPACQRVVTVCVGPPSMSEGIVSRCQLRAPAANSASVRDSTDTAPRSIPCSRSIIGSVSRVCVIVAVLKANTAVPPSMSFRAVPLELAALDHSEPEEGCQGFIWPASRVA